MARNNRRSILKPDEPMFGKILVLIVIFGVLTFLVMLFKLFDLQIVQGTDLGEQAANQQIREIAVNAARGTIYDRSGNILAISATTYNVFISPYEILRDKEDASLIAQTLSELLGMTYDEIYDHMKNEDSWYEMLKTKVDADTADKITAFKKDNKINGIHFEAASTRFYPNGTLACHVLGYVGDEGTGLSGIEYKYDDYLKGTDGSTVSITARGGTALSYAQSSAVNGSDITLTLDVGIQSIIEKHLTDAIDTYKVENGGACIVMDVETGAILGMASCDTFDPNDYQKISDEALEEINKIADPDERSKATANARYAMWKNKALTETYEPGSVFKTVTLSMALDSGAANTDTTFYCGGAMDVIGRKTQLHCWKLDGHGYLNLHDAVCESCNISFTNLGFLVGAERFYKYTEAFGFFDKTGIDLNGEASGVWWSLDIFADKKNMSSLAAASFGQTFGATPMQMICALSCAANGGYLLEPYVVSTVTDSDGKTLYSHGTVVVRQAISRETSETVCELLKDVVSIETATGHSAYIEGYNIAGKTGTSEKIKTITAEGDKDYIVSFGGFAPSDDPQIAVLFLLDTPGKNTGTDVSGGAMAAPVAAKIIKDVLDYMGYIPAV